MLIKLRCSKGRRKNLQSKSHPGLLRLLMFTKMRVDEDANIQYLTMENIGYQRVVNKGHLQYMYLKVKLELEWDCNEVTVLYFKSAIAAAVKDVFGEVGSSFVFDILQYRLHKREAIIRVPHSDYVKLQSSLTLCGFYADKPCAFRILQKTIRIGYWLEQRGAKVVASIPTMPIRLMYSETHQLIVIVQLSSGVFTFDWFGCQQSGTNHNLIVKDNVRKQM